MGKFIVFEGIDGSGKSTQIRLLADRMRENGRKPALTAEPTDSVSGGLLRDALSGLTPRTPTELAALFLIDRVHHNVNPVNGIKKLLSDGFDVICDRYYYSTLAYQGAQTDLDWVAAMNLRCPDILHPDLCIFLDLDPKSCLSRIGNGRSFTEIYEKEATLGAVREKYLEIFDMLSSTDRIVKIDAAGDASAVADRIYSAVSAL